MNVNDIRFWWYLGSAAILGLAGIRASFGWRPGNFVWSLLLMTVSSALVFIATLVQR